MKSEHKQAIKALYRQTRSQAPSSAMDQRIRQSAANAIKPKRSPWVIGLSTAAVLVLSVSVTLQLVETGPELPDTVIERELLRAPQRSSEPVSAGQAAIPVEQGELMDSPVPMMESKPEIPLKRHSGSAVMSSDADRDSRKETIAPDSMPVSPTPMAQRNETTRQLSTMDQSHADTASAQSALAPVPAASMAEMSEPVESADKPVGINAMGVDRLPVKSLEQSKLRTPAPQSFSSKRQIRVVEQNRIPLLPLDAEIIAQSDARLGAVETGPAQHKLVLNGDTILVLTRLSSQVEYEAFAGSEILGVKVDWLQTMSPSELCQDHDHQKVCQREGYQAVFEGGQLKSVKWRQPR